MHCFNWPFWVCPQSTMRLAASFLLRRFSSTLKEPWTRLGKELKNSISIGGPLSVSHFMRSCLTHPQFGYYMYGDVFGKKGDFVTSPEISQVNIIFGSNDEKDVWRTDGCLDCLHPPLLPQIKSRENSHC
jgi:hypothetical protein